jgi:hypothetical protein
MEVSFGDVIAAIALIFSVVSLWRQRKFDAETSRLNSLLIEKEHNEAIASGKADISANFVKVSKNTHHLRIFNRGKSVARNVRMVVLQGKDLFQDNDIASKFPYPSLDSHQPLNVPVYVHMRSPRRATITLSWEDAFGGGQKEMTLDVY